jgi:RNA polymerase sigma factor (sigma-70 family)
MRWGRQTLDDSEDIASITFQALIANQLLNRWMKEPRSKFRTLLCSVARNVISNQVRISSGRQRLIRENQDLLQQFLVSEPGEELQVSSDQLDAFYAAWVEDLVQKAVDRLLEESLKTGHGDRFRVLFGRICEEMSMKDIAKSLRIDVSKAENDFKQAKKRLQDILQDLVREQSARYSPPEEVASAFASEWRELGEFLQSRGGIDAALRNAHELVDARELKNREFSATTLILQTASQQLRALRTKAPPAE